MKELSTAVVIAIATTDHPAITAALEAEARIAKEDRSNRLYLISNKDLPPDLWDKWVRQMGRDEALAIIGQWRHRDYLAALLSPPPYFDIEALRRAGEVDEGGA